MKHDSIKLCICYISSKELRSMFAVCYYVSLATAGVLLVCYVYISSQFRKSWQIEGKVGKWDKQSKIVCIPPRAYRSLDPA